MSDATEMSTREVRELTTEVNQLKSAVRLAIGASVGVAVATPVMIMVTVSKFMRPEWMQGRQTLLLFWAVLVLLSFAVAWTAVTVLRKRTAGLP
ncbi:hypothetical protein [Halosimplex amylolyticum]|uniref:hypothetical protein n=1 Tax=Halosimplex amylolyticum TaxID=3396616 RepID=UPI003F5692F0